VASGLLARLAHKKRYSPAAWFVLGFGGFILASELVRAIIPDAKQAIARGETPGTSYILWSDPAFRADFVLLLLLVALGIALVHTTTRLIRYSRGQAQDDSGQWLPPATTAQKRASAIGSALVIIVPVVMWLWAGLWLAIRGQYTAIILPATGFLGLAIITALLWYRLQESRRDAAFWGLVVVVILAQLRFNATRPPGSMFESNGSVPFFMPLIPIIVGLSAAQIVRMTLPHRRFALMGWYFGLLCWSIALIGWFVKLMGFYDYQPSYAFDLGSLLEAPIRLLVALTAPYYDLIPRDMAPDANSTNMARMESGLTLLAGIAVWAWAGAYLRWRLPARAQRRTLADAIGRLRGIRLTLQQKRYVLAFVLITPAVALRTFTTFYPFAQTIILSVQKYNPAFPPRRYIALRNFERLSTDLVVRESLEFTILFVFVSTFFQVFLGLAIAHLLNANFRLRGIARTISLIPWAMPMVVAAIGFRWMFDDQFGMIPDLLQRVGYDGKWLVDPENAQIAVTFANVWKSTPFAALLLLAGLQGISQDLYEAAEVDGANWFDSLRFITVPMLLPIIVTISMFLLVWQLAVFDLPFAMTGGGPGFATTVVAQKVYLEINSLNFSYAAAISIALVIVVTVVGGLGLFTLRRVEVSA